MALSWQEVTTNILALNRPDSPAIYVLAGASIIGSWNFSGQAKGLLESQTIDKEYQITFTLDEPNHTFSYVEKMGEGRSTVGIDQKTGVIDVNMTTSVFKGKQWGTHRAEKTTMLGGQAGGNTIEYNFKPDQIKKPVIDLLKSAGWSEQKQGFLSGFFGK